MSKSFYILIDGAAVGASTLITIRSVGRVVGDEDGVCDGKYVGSVDGSLVGS